MSLAIGLFLGLGLFGKEASRHAPLSTARSLFLPGQTSAGHYQIELACESCHLEAFGGRESINESCVKCHGAELKTADDKHPKSKFTDPRNADRTAAIDATLCVTCHVEHRPQITQTMGVTVPADFCAHCHSGETDITKDRPSHKGMAFNTCASAGCHNFHDNRALYEDFLLKHAQDPAMTARQVLPSRNLAESLAQSASYPAARYPLKPLALEQLDAPAGVKAASDSRIAQDWLATAHARSGVNCSGCHETEKAKWVEKPGRDVCAGCHGAETRGFLAGKHGMKLAQGLPAMTPAAARQPMKADALGRELSCTSCHGAHRFDTRQAAVDGCLACHNDRHSLAFKQSPHFALLQKERSGELPAGSGVSCASCHLPRVDHYSDEGKRLMVEHNQNDMLRPNEKMIRPVCLGCHGLGFAIDSLADRNLIERNFKGRPSTHVRSIDMALERARQLEAEKNAAATKSP